MLQSKRNEQTLKILERLRKQGAPAGSPATPLMDGEELEGEELESPPTPEEPDASGIVTDTGMPGSPEMAAAKRLLKRRR